MAPPTWITGQVLTASDVNSWFVPLAAVKTADQSVTSSTTLVNDTQLLVAVAASATYRLDALIYYTGGTTGSSDLKLGWTVPAGTTITGGADSVANPLAVAQVFMTQSSVLFSATNGAGNPFPISLWGTVVTSGTAGNLQLQWAQNTSSATSTIVKTASLLTLLRVS